MIISISFLCKNVVDNLSFLKERRTDNDNLLWGIDD